MLIDQYHSLLTQGWQETFPQQRTLQRAVEHALTNPCCYGRRTLSRTICALNRHQQDWSADYKIYSRSPWNENNLFQPIIDYHLTHYPHGFIPVAVDDTKLKKNGRKIPGTSWQRDPLSPPFHTNFVYALRFIQAALIFHHNQADGFDSRSLPIRFCEAPVVKKPGKRAGPDDIKAYRQLKKQFSLSAQTLTLVRNIRLTLDQRGAAHRFLLLLLDGSFCNRIVFRSSDPLIEMVARCRKDARLCLAAAPGQRRKYDSNIFTPEQVRQDDSIPYQTVDIRFGGKTRTIRYKERLNVLWRRGAATRPLRLIVIAPQPYKVSPHARTNYRQPAYLLCTDLSSSIQALIQAYFDRWQIEVNHRDEKSILGVGQAQLRSKQSVPRQPAFMVASYSLMLLAALKEFGPTRTADYMPLPKWRKQASRPSLLDIIALMRKEHDETRVSTPLSLNLTKNTANYAYT